MPPVRSQRKPSFLWQGMLILLPVMVMAAIALAAIVQDRAAAEREARRQAEELLRQVGSGFDRAMGLQLNRFAGGKGGYSQLWSKQHLTEPALRPWSRSRLEVEQGRRALDSACEEAETAFAELARVSGLRPEEIVLSELAFSPEGKVISPPAEAREAQPPLWRLELTPEQIEALKGLEELDASSANTEQANAAVKRFLDTGPPGQSQANAEFIRLRLVLSKSSASDAVQQWLDFAQRCSGEPQRGVPVPAQQPTWRGAMSELGVPLSNLAVAKAWQQARETGVAEELWTALVREVERAPSSFTPMLLELAEPLLAEPVTEGRPLQSCLHALRLRWETTERTWEAADVIQRSGRLQGIATTNFWLDFQDTRWLCLLQPDQSWRGRGPSIITNSFTQARLCPKAAVEQALRTVVRDSKISLPAYLRLSAEVEGELLSLNSGSASAGGKRIVGTMLAQVEGRLTCPATLEYSMTPGNGPVESASRPGRPRATLNIQVAEGPNVAGSPIENRMEPGNHTVEFEAMPSRPHFILRVELADRAQLFAAQQRRTWLFGTLVLAAALTAAVGFGSAYRSFRRQLRLNEMKSNFVSSVSHELRAPIASVRLMAESLERGKIADAPKQHEYFRFIGQECRRLSSLIENVLDFSRIEQGRKQYEFEPTDIVELTRQTVKLMETYAVERGVRLDLQLPNAAAPNPNLQPAIDGKAMQQALINLIDNALKHSPKGGKVTVGLEVQGEVSGRWSVVSSQSSVVGGEHASRTRCDGASARRVTPHALAAPERSGGGSRITLWVEDHGPGIPAHEHEKIFERFYRLGSELRRETQGVGIGLSIVKHVVEAHGGRVIVRSKVGTGSRFSIELPTQLEQTKPETRAPKSD
jgi:signal transduction histidine kinase